MKNTPYHKRVTLKITCCMECPHQSEVSTKGYGHAVDHVCTLKNNEVIAGYVEWASEEPQPGEIPVWCPLAKKKSKR